MKKGSLLPVYLFFILMMVVFSSCSKRIYHPSNNQPVIFPPPPDTARIQFLSKFSNSNDVVGKKSQFRTFVTGPEKVMSILKPYGLAIHNGRIFIADAPIAGLQIINLEKTSFEYFTPGGRGQLIFPLNCFVDAKSDLYVTDVERKQVIIFNEKLEYKGEISGAENFKPTDVIVIGDTILVTDPNNNRINVYDRSSLQQLFSFPNGAEVGDENWLYNPLNICIAEGKIYITDFGDSRIKTFSMKGDYLSSIGSYGNNLAQFVRPKGTAVDRDQNLYVVDAGFENIQIFNHEGQLLMYFGGPYKRPGDMYLPANVVIDYDHLEFFEKYVDPAYELRYLIFVTNQYGPDKVSVYGRVEPKK